MKPQAKKGKPSRDPTLGDWMVHPFRTSHQEISEWSEERQEKRLRKDRTEKLENLKRKTDEARQHPALLLYHRELETLSEEMGNYLVRLEEIGERDWDQVEQVDKNWVYGLGEFIEGKSIEISRLTSAAENTASEDPFTLMDDGSGAYFLQAKGQIGGLVLLNPMAGKIGDMGVTEYVKQIQDDPDRDRYSREIQERLGEQIGDLILERLDMGKQDVPLFRIPEPWEVEDKSLTPLLYRSAVYRSKQCQEEYDIAMQRAQEVGERISRWVHEGMKVAAHLELEELWAETLDPDGGTPKGELMTFSEKVAKGEEIKKQIPGQREKKLEEMMTELIDHLKAVDKAVDSKDALFKDTLENQQVAKQYKHENPEECADLAEEEPTEEPEDQNQEQ